MNKQRELKEAYKNQKFKIGVFQIRNTVNGKIFVGSSLNLDAIWNRNRSELSFGGHRNEILQKEWNEFGEDKFLFEILSEIKQDDTANVDYGNEVKTLEQMFIEELQPFDEKGYNPRKRR